MKKTNPWIYLVSIAVIALVAIAPVWTCRDEPAVIETIERQYSKKVKANDAKLQDNAVRRKDLEKRRQVLVKKKQALTKEMNHVMDPKDDVDLVARFHALGYHPFFK